MLVKSLTIKYICNARFKFNWNVIFKVEGDVYTSFSNVEKKSKTKNGLSISSFTVILQQLSFNCCCPVALNWIIL